MSAPDAARFDRLAPTYDQAVPFFAAAGERLVEWAELGPGQRILDLGAGRGAVTRAVWRALGPEVDVVAGDVSTEMLARLGALALPGVQVKYLDATAMDEPDSSFDVVLSAFVFHFLAGRAQALAEVARVLRPGGTFAISVPGNDKGWDEAYAQIIDEFRGRAQLPPPKASPVGAWEDLAVAAGLRVVARTNIEIVLPLEGPEQYWSWLLAHSHQGLYDALDETGRQALHERVVSSLREDHPAGGRQLVVEADFYRMTKAQTSNDGR